MYSEKFGCEYINLVDEYRSSDRRCAPANWLSLLWVRDKIGAAANTLGCDVTDILIRKGRGSASVCWIHPILFATWKSWANLQKMKDEDTEEELVEVDDQFWEEPDKEDVVETQDTEKLSDSDLANWKIHLEALVLSSDPYPVEFDKAWQWIRYSKKNNAKRVLTSNFKKDVDYILLLSSEQQDESKHGGSNRKEIRLTTDCFKKFCMMAGTSTGEAVRNYFLECERRLKEVNAVHKPTGTGNAHSFLEMIESDLNRLGVGEPWILRWKYGALKSLNPDHSQMFEDALELILPACAESDSRVNVSTISDLLQAKYNLEIEPTYLNQLWIKMGLQIPSRTAKSHWMLTDDGKKYGASVPYENRNNGHKGYQILWSTAIADATFDYLRTEGEKPDLFSNSVSSTP